MLSAPLDFMFLFGKDTGNSYMKELRNIYLNITLFSLVGASNPLLPRIFPETLSQTKMPCPLCPIYCDGQAERDIGYSGAEGCLSQREKSQCSGKQSSHNWKAKRLSEDVLGPERHKPRNTTPTLLHTHPRGCAMQAKSQERIHNPQQVRLVMAFKIRWPVSWHVHIQYSMVEVPVHPFTVLLSAQAFQLWEFWWHERCSHYRWRHDNCSYWQRGTRPHPAAGDGQGNLAECEAK